MTEAIQTIVFLDLETTSLIRDDSPSDPINQRWMPGGQDVRNPQKMLSYYLRTDRPACIPRITELSMIAISRMQYEKAVETHMKESSSSRSTSDGDRVSQFPLDKIRNDYTRVAKIYSTQINPELDEKEWQEYENSQMKRSLGERLNKLHLATQNTFADEWPVLQRIFQNLKKPACLVAHNGLRFDFRIIFHELRRCKLLEQYPVPEGVHFLDSYPAFLDLEKEYHRCVSNFIGWVDWPKVTRLIAPEVPVCTTEASIVSSSNAEQITASYVLPTAEIAGTEQAESIESQPGACDFLQKPKRDARGDITPAKHQMALPPQSLIHLQREEKSEERAVEMTKAKRRLEFDVADTNPLLLMKKDGWSLAKKRRLIDKSGTLLMRTHDGDWKFNSAQAGTYFCEKGRFSLPKMHEQIYGGQGYKAHRAQDDAEALMMTCLAYGAEFLRYLDTYSAPLKIADP